MDSSERSDIAAGHRSRDALIAAGIALSRPVTLDRVLHELAQQIRQVIPHDALAIALLGDDAALLRLAHHSGFEDSPATIEERLAPRWRDSIARSVVLIDHTDRGIRITAPLAAPGRVVGAVTILAEDGASPHKLDDAGDLLRTLAAQTGAAIERSWLVQRSDRRNRVEAGAEVAASIAQELRNPLFGISSAAQLLRFRAREDPVVEKNVGRILRELDRLNRIASALLEYGRPVTPSLTPGDPDTIWDEVLHRERGLLESRSLHLKRYRGEPAARVPIDRDQLAQVLGNILVNAVDAAPEATDLTLTTSTLPGGAWRSRLHNGGRTISAEALPRAFDLFVSTRTGGSGIGLALAQRIIEAHGGTIAIESSGDAGTTVTIELPSVS